MCCFKLKIFDIGYCPIVFLFRNHQETAEKRLYEFLCQKMAELHYDKHKNQCIMQLNVTWDIKPRGLNFILHRDGVWCGGVGRKKYVKFKEPCVWHLPVWVVFSTVLLDLEQNPELILLLLATDYPNWQDLPPECTCVCVCPRNNVNQISVISPVEAQTEGSSLFMQCYYLLLHPSFNLPTALPFSWALLTPLESSLVKVWWLSIQQIFDTHQCPANPSLPENPFFPEVMVVISTCLYRKRKRRNVSNWWSDRRWLGHEETAGMMMTAGVQCFLILSRRKAHMCLGEKKHFYFKKKVLLTIDGIFQRGDWAPDKVCRWLHQEH